MWRRFSSSATTTTTNDPQPAKPEATTKDPPPPPPPTPNSTNPIKPATTLAQKLGIASPVKEHELPAQPPVGTGQRRRSSILDKLNRESTKEGITRHVMVF